MPVTPFDRAGEFNLLCMLAVADPDAGRIQRIANSDLGAIDWRRFLNLAGNHGVLPLAARNLIEHRGGDRQLHSDVEDSLRSAYEANLKGSLWFATELARIMRCFEAKQVAAIPFKGPLLSQCVYHDIALRSFSDLDFLIPADEFQLAKKALAEIGYSPATNFSLAIERFELRHNNERVFDGAAGKNLVELQWAVVPRFFSVDLRVEDLFRRAGRAVVAGCEMPCLSPEDSLLVLCIHAAKHLWTRLIWLVDIAETLRNQNIDYASAFAEARLLGIARILGVSFWLVKNVLQRELAPAVEKFVASDSSVPSLGSEFAARLADGITYNFATTEYFRFVMNLRERQRDRGRFLWRLAWTPSPGDISALRLPEPLFPFYRVVRIARLGRRLLSSLFARWN